MEAILTGEPIPAQRAYDLGLVSRLVQPGEAVDEAFLVAERIAANRPLAVWASREIVLAAATPTTRRSSTCRTPRVHSSCIGRHAGGPHRVPRETGARWTGR